MSHASFQWQAGQWQAGTAALSYLPPSERFENNMLKQSRVISEVQECLLLAVPLAGAQLAQTATGLVDTLMMGWLGSQVLAAGALGATTFTVLLTICAATVSAVSPLVAEAYGAGKVQEVGRITRQGLWLAVLLAIPLMLLIWHAVPILHHLGQETNTIALTNTYLRAILWGYLPGLGFAVLRSTVTSLSRPRPVIIIVTGGTLVNVAANYVLMFGKLGFPTLGLAGIGWASTLSLWIMFLALVGYMLSQSDLQQYGMFRNLLRIDGRVFWDLLRVGVPIGILVTVEAGLFAVTTFLMGQLGTVTLAAHQIALQSAATTFTIALGISFANTIRVGQLMGQGEPDHARLAGYIGITLGAGFMGAMGLLFWLLPTQIVGLYLDTENPSNAAVVTLAKTLLGVAAIFQVADGIQVTAAGALRGVKDTRIPMVIGFFAYWCIGLTSGYLLGVRFALGSVGFWWGLAIGLAVAAIVLTWRFATQKLANKTLPELDKCNA